MRVYTRNIPWPESKFLGMTREQVRELYGDPDMVDGKPWPNNDFWVYEGHPAAAVFFENDAVVKVTYRDAR